MFKKIAIVLPGLLLAQTAFSQSQCIDTDGDGWGWDGTASCLIAAPDTSTTACIDTDGDGYGWNGTATCVVTSIDNETPTGNTTDADCIDSDGDGYGWDGTTTCIINSTDTQTTDFASTAQCIDIDGDGWGWNGTASCLITGDSTGDDTSATDHTGSTDDNSQSNTDTSSGIATSNFVAGALLSSDIVSCTLSDGTATQCYELVTVGVAKTTDMIGPFCPGSVSSADGGIWLDGDSIHEANGDFFLNLPNLYGNAYPPADNWILYDDNGNVRITDTLEACQAAARPDVDPAYQSHCVECSLEDLETDALSMTFLIPVTPSPADNVGALSAGAGISLNGFQIAAQAPVEDILSNWTIAAFDDCGGHVNPNDGYHYHAATGAEGCNSAGTESDGHPALIGYAMDGYGIYGTLTDTDTEAGSLDQCNGFEDDTRGYHYHASSAEKNQHIACFHGLTVNSTEDNRPPRPQ